MKFLRSPIILGLAVFVLAVVALAPLLPTTCADGWQSQSIGIQGACSSHGGVAASKDVIRFGPAALLGIGVGGGLAFLRRRNSRTVAPTERRVADLPTCPTCGAPLKMVTATGDARYRWVCSAQPNVHVIDQVEAAASSGGPGTGN